MQSPLKTLCSPATVEVRLISRSLNYFRQLFSSALSRPLSFSVSLTLTCLLLTHSLSSACTSFSDSSSQNTCGSPTSPVPDRPRGDLAMTVQTCSQRSRSSLLCTFCFRFVRLLSTLLFSLSSSFCGDVAPADKKNAPVRRN